MLNFPKHKAHQQESLSQQLLHICDVFSPHLPLVVFCFSGELNQELLETLTLSLSCIMLKVH